MSYRVKMHTDPVGGLFSAQLDKEIVDRKGLSERKWGKYRLPPRDISGRKAPYAGLGKPKARRLTSAPRFLVKNETLLDIRTVSFIQKVCTGCRDGARPVSTIGYDSRYIKMFSISCNSSPEKEILSNAFRLSINWATELAPINTLVTRSSFNNQASAISAKVCPRRAATSFSLRAFSTASGVT